MLSEAFVNYARDLKRDPNVGIIYVDPELRPVAPSPRALLDQAATAGPLARYRRADGVDEPGLCASSAGRYASRMYRNQAERQLLAVNLERARALPSGNHRYVVVNPAAQRLYMYENGEVVDHMRVVAGKPAPAIAQTPMMSALIRFTVLNPYWNAPTDITAHKLAPNVLKQGRCYLKAKGYQVMSDWTDRARVVDPASVDWQAVVAGRVPIRLRQIAWAGQFDGSDEVHVPQRAGHLAPRHAAKGSARGGRAAAEQRLRPARGRAAVRSLAVRPAAQGAGRKARAKGSAAEPGAALHHVFDGGPERVVDRLFRGPLRARPAHSRRQPLGGQLSISSWAASVGV